MLEFVGQGGGTSSQDINVNQKTLLIVNTAHVKSNHLEGNSELHHVEDLGGWIDKV